MNEHKAVPNIRFNGFKSNWEKIQLKNYVTWYKGSGLSKKYLNVKNIGAPVIHYSDLYKFSEVIKNVRHWSTTNQGKLISNNSILFPSSDVTPNGLARTSALVKNGVKAGGDIIIGTLKTSLSNVFMSYQINRNYKDILRMVSGTTIRHIHATDLSNLSEYITYYPEQQKIGDFFTKLDKLLDLQQQKIDKLELLKKTLLQKLFPKHDAKIPELRFKGFEGDWAKIQLKNYVTWYKGNGLSKKHLNVEKIGAPVIHYSDLYKFSEVIKNVRHWSTTNQGKLISNNSILFPSSDVTPNGLARTSALIKSGVKAGGDIIIGTLETSLSNVFMSYQINRNFKDILRMVSGTTIRHIHANDLSNLSEYITYYPEQQKIGNLLSKVDQLIELENKKLQNFQQVKKCLLQNMFVE